MAIEKMRLVSVSADIEALDDVLSVFVDLKNFHAEPANKIAESVDGVELLNDVNPYSEQLSRMKEAAAMMNYPLQLKHIEDEEKIDSEAIKNQILQLQQKYENSMKIKASLEQVIQENQDALKQLEHLEGLGISIDELLSCEYLKVRFGRLPLDNVDKLKYYKNRPFLFRSLHEDSMYSWCMYISTPLYEKDVDNVFSSLYFERIEIPQFVHGEPALAVEALRKEIEDDEKQLAVVNQTMKDMFDHSSALLDHAYAYVMKRNRMFEARKYVVCFGKRFSLIGFVPKKEVDQVKEKFTALAIEIEFEDRPAHSDKRLQPPTRLMNHWLSKPFAFFVEMYGIPEYEGFDPTALVAITYTLLFGIMFADLGQGLLLSAFCFILYHKKGYALAAIGERIGLSSALFGILYGSFFGNETALNPLYQMLFQLEDKPIDVLDSSFTMTLLLCAVGIGVIIICICMLINTIMSLKNHQLADALFSQNGLAGLVFYTSLLYGVVMMLMNKNVMNTLYILILIVLPLVLVFLKEPIENKMQHKRLFPDGFGSFFTSSFFELFEVLLTFIANTMSFLRVGGFVLSHAGMMLVVMTLAEMVGPNAAWVVIIIGNLFVMVLEGMIVGIQVLRLQFYEMFSRFYEGKGIPFASIYDIQMKGME